MIKRSSFIPLLIGVIAALVGLTSVSWLRQGRCIGAGGQWIGNMQQCKTASGPLDVARFSDQIAGLAVGLILAFMLHRGSTFFRSRRVRQKTA